MIVSMKKIHVIALKKHIDAALSSLRALGSIHVEHQEPLTGYQLEERREEARILQQSIEILQAHHSEDRQQTAQKDATDWTEIVNAILELSAEIDHYRDSMVKRETLSRMTSNG